MAQRVGVVGIGQTKYEKAKKEIFYEVAFEAADIALADAGLERGELDNIVLAGYDVSVGRTISNMYTCSAAGGYLKDEIRVSDDGIYAAALAYLRILGGFDITMVLGYGVSSEGPLEMISNLSLDAIFHRFTGLSDRSALALQAGKFIDKYNISEEDGAKVTVKNRKNALKNPFAYLQKEVTIEEVMKSKLISWPLKELNYTPRSDGCCAVIMAPEAMAIRIKENPVWIDGISWANDTYYLGDKDLSTIPSLEIAAKGAYRMAGIKNPLEEIDVAELHEPTSYHELMEYPALGFCQPEEVTSLLNDGITEIGGKLPVNPSGGALSADPFGTTGLARLAEAALQVRGEAGQRQIQGVKRALAQGSVGLAMQGNCVVILSKE